MASLLQNIPALSYWESQNLLFNPDILVIGAGIVGLNAAYHARLKFPKAKILVLERGLLPMGASTKNAGFSCFGSAGELLDDLENQSESEVFELVKNRYQGLQLLRETLGDQTIDFDPCGGFELFLPGETEHFLQCQSSLDFLNNQLCQIHGLDSTYSEKTELVSQFGFKQVKSMLFNRLEGSIHTGKTMVALWKKCIESDIMILNGFECRELIPRGNGFEIKLSIGISLHTEKVIVATNAFAGQLLPGLAIQPGRAQVLITSPIDKLPFSGTFHFDRGYYYFRNVGNRVLFGGGRNLDFEGEQTFDFELSHQIQSQLELYLHEVILPGKSFSIEQRWSGIMGLGPNKGTILKKLESGLVIAVRMGGMGVALGSLVGKKASELLD